MGGVGHKFPILVYSFVPLSIQSLCWWVMEALNGWFQQISGPVRISCSYQEALHVQFIAGPELTMSPLKYSIYMNPIQVGTVWRWEDQVNTGGNLCWGCYSSLLYQPMIEPVIQWTSLCWLGEVHSISMSTHTVWPSVCTVASFDPRVSMHFFPTGSSQLPSHHKQTCNFPGSCAAHVDEWTKNPQLTSCSFPVVFWQAVVVANRENLWHFRNFSNKPKLKLQAKSSHLHTL